MANLDKLEFLLVSGDGISDAGVALLAKLPHLSELNLMTPLLTNEGLRQLGNCRSLTSLDLKDSRHNISIAGMNYLNSLTNLKYLWVHNVAQDQATLQLGGLKNLEVLTLEMRRSGPRNNRVQDSWRDEDCACLAQMRNLRQLSISGAGDAGMKYLAGLEKMERLGLSRMEISDQGMEYLSGMKRLFQLGVDGSTLTDATLARLEKLKGLNYLSVKSEAGFSQAAVERLRRSLPGLITCQIDPIDNNPQ